MCSSDLRLTKIEDEDFRLTMASHVEGTLNVMRATVPTMRAHGYGRIVNTSSIAVRGTVAGGAYGAAKGAIESLTRTLAAEGARRNINVNAISPYALSQMTAPYMTSEVAARFSPEQVVPMVLWLASEQSQASGEIIVAGDGYFRRGYNVETASATGDDLSMAGVFKAISNRPGTNYPSSNAAFESLLLEMGLLRTEGALEAKQD